MACCLNSPRTPLPQVPFLRAPSWGCRPGCTAYNAAARPSQSERHLVRLLLERFEHRGDLDLHPFLLSLRSNQPEHGNAAAPFPTRSASAHMSPSSWRPGGSCTHRLALDSSYSLKSVSARPPDPQQAAAPSPASLVPHALSPSQRPRAVNLALGSAGLALSLPLPLMAYAACLRRP